MARADRQYPWTSACSVSHGLQASMKADDPGPRRFGCTGRRRYLGPLTKGRNLSTGKTTQVFLMNNALSSPNLPLSGNLGRLLPSRLDEYVRRGP